MVKEQNKPNLSKNGTKGTRPLPTDQSLWQREELEQQQKEELEQRQKEELEQQQSYFLLTNRYNLVDILSSGLIKPASQYTKYYRDLGDACHEAIPFLTCIPSASLIEEVIDIDPTTFPVLLQVDLQGMHGTVRVIRNDYQVEQMELPIQGEALSVVITGAIPATRIQAVYFRSYEERAEHMDREYDNIRRKFGSLYVSSEHFQGSDIDNERLLAAIDHINTKLSTQYSENFRDANALGGAFLMLGGLVTHDSRIELDMLIPPLTALQDSVSGVKRLKTARRPSKVDGWLTLLPSLLLDERTSSGESDQVLERPEIVAPSEEDRIATLLFATTVKTLARISLNDYYPERALKSIYRAFEAEVSAAESEKENQSLLQYQEKLDAIRAVLQTEKGLARFPYIGDPLVAALLFFLLRSEPERVLSLRKEQQQLAPEVLVIAVVFSGILYHREMIPVICRSTPTFEHFVDDIVAQRLNLLHQGPVTNQTLKEISIKRYDGERKESLGISGYRSALIVRNIPVPVTQSAEDDKGFSNVVKQLLSLDLTREVEKEVAMYLCRRADWNDCVTTVIGFKEQKVSLDTLDCQKAELRVQGFVTPVWECRIKEDAFHKFVRDKWRELPKEILREVEAKLKRVARPLSDGKYKA